jgi:hypothetical protein
MAEIDNIRITNRDKLLIYVIGYKSLGESIVILLGNNRDGYRFSGVIDSFKTKDLFVTKELLDLYNIKKLNFICWTHPDWDHTLGLVDLFEYFNEDESYFIMPEGILGKDIRDTFINDYNDNRFEAEYCRLYERINQIKPENFETASKNKEIFNFNLIKRDKSINVTIKAFAPVPKTVRDQSLEYIYSLADEVSKSGIPQKKWYKKLDAENNLYSAGLQLILKSPDMGRRSICLTGDLHDDTIDVMGLKYINAIFEYNDIFKVPHHSSTHADKLFSTGCLQKFKYGVTTSYASKDLPNGVMMRKYLSKCTGDFSRTDAKDDSYGSVLYTILLKDLFLEDPIFEGAADNVGVI